MRKKIRIIAVICFLIGFVVFCYPFAGQYIYNQKADVLIQTFEQTAQNPVNATPLETLRQTLADENSRLARFGQDGLKDPFAFEQPGIDLLPYGFDENIIGYLEIPAINQKLPIYLGANQHNMNLGATHLTQTSYPLGGADTNTVLAAHRGYTKAYMFRDIQKLQQGDQVIIHNFWETLVYTVSQADIIDPGDIDAILIQNGKDMVTLITCHPYGSNTQRYIVYCERES